MTCQADSCDFPDGPCLLEEDSRVEFPVTLCSLWGEDDTDLADEPGDDPSLDEVTVVISPLSIIADHLDEHFYDETDTQAVARSLLTELSRFGWTLTHGSL